MNLPTVKSLKRNTGKQERYRLGSTLLRKRIQNDKHKLLHAREYFFPMRQEITSTPEFSKAEQTLKISQNPENPIFIN